MLAIQLPAEYESKLEQLAQAEQRPALDIIRQALDRYFAEAWRPAQPRSSKWARIAQAAHDESPLDGLSGYVLACSQEIRENFTFAHDEAS